MKSQKYSGRARLSRNKWNLEHTLLSTPPSSRLFQIDTPFGPVYIDKSSPNKHMKNIDNEFKDQFKAHQIFKSYYGDLNLFQSHASLLQLESRLDVLVYRTGSPRSIFEARNLIRHKKVFVNDSPVPLSDIFSHLHFGQSFRIEFPYKYEKNPASTNILVKHLPNNITYALLVAPIYLSNIRYPKGLNIDKLQNPR